jgi:hypothetical protein
MKKLLLGMGLLVIGALPLAASAHGGISVGIGLGLPIYGGPAYYDEPVVEDYGYYAPRRVYYSDDYYRPYYGPRYYGGGRVNYRDYDRGDCHHHDYDYDDHRGDHHEGHGGHGHHGRHDNDD